jgi:hypothetical protein
MMFHKPIMSDVLLDLQGSLLKIRSIQGASVMPLQILRIVIILVFLFSLFPMTVSADDDHSIEFIVKDGDNLYNICEKILENPDDWRWVAMVNRISNPHRIFPGQKLIIPTRLLKGIPIDGLVTFIKGVVSIKLAETEDWKKLQLNDKITQGNWIRTSDQGTIEISFQNHFSVLLRPNTIIEITAARKKSAIYLMYKLFLDIGKAITKIKQSTGKETRFEIKTPSAVAAARGTEFRTGVDSDVTTRLEVLAGMVDVQAAKQKVAIKAGQGTVVKKDQRPAVAVNLLLPPAIVNLQPLYRAMPLDFQFESIAGATSYRVMLARDKTFKDVVKNKIIKPQETLKIVGVEDGTYFLQSRAIDDRGLEGPSLEPTEIRVRVNPLPPFIQSPSDGADLREKTAQFEWLNVAKAVRYHLQVAEDRQFNQIITDQADINDNSIQTENLDFKTYYFRISSIAADGYQGIWSDILGFNIIPPPPAPPVEAPQLEEKTIRIRWRDLGEGITYHFQMAKDEAFSEILVNEKLTKPEITLEKPADAGKYYVRTSAVDTEGYEGAFSEPQIFEVKGNYPFLPAGIMILAFLALIIL